MAQKFLTDIEVTRGLVDSSGDLGVAGQVLSSTGSGTNWITNEANSTVVYLDEFTGDNSTVDFTISVSVTDENITQVYIDGVYQNKDTYSVSNTTLTFSTAPPLNADIEVITFSTATTSDDLSAGSVIIPVKNTHTASIAKGQPVYITGNVGSSARLQIAPADASNSAKMPAAGLLLQTLAVNAEGYVITGGYLRNITTDTIDGTSTSSNDTVYVKSGGGLTMTKPTGTNLIQNIAKVARSSSGNSGSLLVSSILRTNDVPNITNDYFWLGNSSGVATPTEFTSTARGLLSVGAEGTAAGDGNLAYNNSSGVFTYTPPVLGGLSGTTDNITEGSTNLYYTDARSRNSISAGGDLSYNSTTGVMSYTTPTTIASLSNHDTDDLSEGSTNLYYTDTRVGTYLTNNSYATQSYVNTQVSNLVDSAPSTLDTLNELAAALGDDANFSTTVTNSIATKLPLAGGTLTGKLTISQSGSDMIDLTRTSVGTYRLAVSAGDAFSIYDVGAAADRFIIDTSGNAVFYKNVGIGVNPANTSLHVTAQSTSLTNNVAVYIGGGWVGNDAYHKEGGLLVISGTNTTQTGAGIAFQTRNTTNTNYHKGSMIMDRDGALSFELGGQGTSATSEKFKITAAGDATIAGDLTVSGNNVRSKIFESHVGHPYLDSDGSNNYVKGGNSGANVLYGQYSSFRSIGNIYPHTNVTYNLGDSSLVWANSYANTAYASILYDRDNTSYYVNPASNSLFLRGYFRVNNTTNYTNAPLLVESYGGSGTTTGIGFHISGQIGRYLSMNSSGVLSWEGSTIWHAGNDGAGTGLDADLLDGQHASAFASSSHTHAASDITSGNLAAARNTANLVNVGSTSDASGIYFRSTNEIISGEGWCTAQYAYNENDGFLFLNRNTSSTAFPTFHIGGWNNAGYAGYSNGDGLLTLTRSDGSKNGGSTYAGTGLSNTSYYTNIIKTTTKTIFRDAQSLHEFTGNVLITGSGSANSASLQIDNPSSSTFNHSIEAFAANLTNGESNILLVGKEGSTKNAGYLGYYWTASGSNNNFVSLGHWAADHLFRVYGDQVLSTITLRGNVDMRAPIFYDKDNTSYYVDAATNSVLQQINLYGQLQMQRGQANNAIWWAANTDQNHALWNDYYGGPTTRGAAGSGFDGIKWNTYRGLHIRGGSAGAYNCIVVTNTSSNTNTHTVALYAHDDEVLKTTNSSNNGIIVQRDLYLSGSKGGNTGNQLVIGQTSDSLAYTIQDTNVRPLIYMTGKYPALTLNHTVTTNTNHGPTIQYTFNGSNGRQWVHGASGDGEHFDFGYADTASGNSNYNPHNGISGYQGVTFMTFKQNGNIGIGSAGDWGGLGGGDPAYAIDTRGTLYNNTDVRAPIFYDSNNTNFYAHLDNSGGNTSINAAGVIRGNWFVASNYTSTGYTIYKGYDNWNHFISIRGHARPGQSKAQAAIAGGHQTSFVEYAENNATTGWFFIGSAGSTYEEIAKITKDFASFTQVRAPIFYDSNNTNYYVDPATSTNLSGNTRIINTRFGVSTSGSFNFGTGYGFHTIENGSSNEPICMFYHQVATTSTQHYGINIISAANHNNTTSRFMLGQGGSSEKIKIYSNGNIQNQNNSYGQLSDINLKENIVDATPKLDDINQVRVVNFNYIGDVDEETNIPNKQIGVVAQELEEIFPGIVYECGDTETPTKAVKYSVFVPMLIKAVQELTQEVQTLKDQINGIN